MPEAENERAWVQRHIIDNFLRELSDSEIRAFLAYVCDVNADGLSRPGNPDVSIWTGLSIRSVQRAAKMLVNKHKLLSKTSKGTGGRHVFTEYKVIDFQDVDDTKRCWIPKWIIYYVLRDMTESEIRAFLVYTRHANLEGESYPGNPLISYKTGLSIRSVQRAVKSLVKKGLLTKASKGTGGRRVFTKYLIISQTWKDYQTSGTMPGTTAGGASEDSQGRETTSEQGASEGVPGDSEAVSEPELSTNPATPVMVCGKQHGKDDNRESGYCGKLPTNHDTDVMEGHPGSEKPCQPCRETMTPGVVNHDRAMSTEVIKKKLFKGYAVGKDQNHDNGKRRKTATAGIEGIAKKLFKSVNSVCNTKRQAGKMIQDLRQHLAKQEAVAV